MARKWTDIAFQGKYYKRQWTWITHRIEELQKRVPFNDGIDEKIIKYVHLMTLITKTYIALAETSGHAKDIEELKSIIYNLPEPILAEVRAKLGK